MDKLQKLPKTYTQKEVDTLLSDYDIRSKIDKNYEKTEDLFKSIEKQLKDMSGKISNMSLIHNGLNKRIEAIEEKLKFEEHDREVRRKEVEDQREKSERKLYEIYQKVGIISGIIGILGGTGAYAIVHFLLFKN